MIEIIRHTPVWVFGLLAGLFLMGYSQSRQRIISTTRAFILPIIMVLFSLGGVASSFGINAASILAWALGLFLMVFISARFFPPQTVSFDQERALFLIPGSWMPLIVMMGIFCAKYWVGFMMATQQPLVKLPVFLVSMSLVYGVFSGFFAARALGLWRVKQAGLPMSLNRDV